MARRKGPKTIEDSGFAGLGADIGVEILEKVQVESFHECAAAILDGWDQTKPIALPQIILSASNTEVINSSISLEGCIFSAEGKNVNAKKIWGSNRQIYLRMGKLDLAKFTFRGRLYSEYIDGDQTNYTLVENDEV